MKTAYRITIATLMLAAIIVGAASIYMLNYSLKPQRRSRAEALERLAHHTPVVMAWVDSIVASGTLRDTTITLTDGTTRHGYYLPAHTAATRTAVLVHGYKDCALSMMHIGCMYHRDLGYNILLPDLWAHGESTGDHINMGWNERHEVLQWVQVAHTMFHCDTLVLHGISMGGATVMNVSGEPLPPCIKAIVEDCGYTSVWDEFTAQLDDQFGLPQFPLMYTTSLLCKLRYGWTFGEASPVEQVKKCKVPMLFIHGDDDDFVPTAMVHQVYAAHPGKKQLWLAPGSAHARAYSDHPQEYTQRVKAFLSTVIQ